MSLLAMLAWALFICALSLFIGYLLGIDRGRDEERAMQVYRRQGDPEFGRPWTEVKATGISRFSWRRP